MNMDNSLQILDRSQASQVKTSTYANVMSVMSRENMKTLGNVSCLKQTVHKKVRTSNKGFVSTFSI